MTSIFRLTTPALLLAAAVGSAQTTGTSHPEALGDDLNAPAPPAAQHYVKPSPAVPQAESAASQAGQPQLQPRIPADPATNLAADPATDPATDPRTPAASSGLLPDDVNSGVVIDVPVGPHELAIGTRLKAYLQSPISTETTRAGATFTAAIQSDILRGGVVLVPAGTLILGRIAQIHGGRRITGAAAIRMQPDSLFFPDGTRYRLNAEVVDVNHYLDSHVNHEGTIVANSHAGTAAIIGGATTGTAVIAGALIGGGVGAVVGLAVGAGAGTVLWLRQDHQQTLPEGTEIIFSVDEPLNLTPATR